MIRTRLNFVLLLSAVIIALPLLLAPANATIPVYVERNKDGEYYFRIQGHPAQQWDPADGVAVVVYKNLGDTKQYVDMIFYHKLIGVDTITKKYFEVLPSEEIPECKIFGDLGTTINFEIYISVTPPPSEEPPADILDTIIIPPP